MFALLSYYCTLRWLLHMSKSHPVPALCPSPQKTHGLSAGKGKFLLRLLGRRLRVQHLQGPQGRDPAHITQWCTQQITSPLAITSKIHKKLDEGDVLH